MPLNYAALSASDGNGEAVRATVQVQRNIGSTTLTVDHTTHWPTGTFIATTGTLLASGKLDPTTVQVFYGTASGTTVTITSYAAGYSDLGSKQGDVVVLKPSTEWSNTIAQYIPQFVGGMVPSGAMSPYAGRTAPSGWLLCDGSAVSRGTYSGLLNVITPLVGTFTVTIATPAVFTLTAHGLRTGGQVYLTTTGALPTGLLANTLYYAVKIDANTFNLATSRANAYAGTKITTSGTQSGVHSLYFCPYGLGDGSTTFNVPDSRGRVIAGDDAMGGTAASRLTLAQSQGSYGNLGAVGGEQGHQLITSEAPSHTHASGGGGTFVGGGAGSAANISVGGSSFVTNNTTNSSGGDGNHNNIQPTLVANHIIKT